MTTPHDNPAASARLNQIRQEIEQIDIALVDLLARRLACAAEIGSLKEALGLPVMDPAREAEVVRHAAELARERGIDPELARDVIWRVIAQARGVQGTRAPAPDGD
jgi:chorismate mutase-like protein